MHSSVIACANCLIDNSDVPRLTFDESGRCFICNDFQVKWQAHLAMKEDRQRKLHESIDRIKEAGKRGNYDCVIGISGGVDSSYLASKIKEFGLRPLAVHFDNGWNSELAVKNIEGLTNSLGIDLHTHVVDWPEFRDLQKAYFRASVIDIEVATDHAIYGTLYQAAAKYGVKYILGGNNIATEGFMPPGWHFQKLDHVNLLDIHRQFGANTLATYPLYTRKLKKKVFRAGIEIVEILDLVEYSRAEAVEVITSQFGWRDYGTKHGESTFTKFYQEYVLPTKFGVNKRKAHLSTLINTGEMSRTEAVLQISNSVYSESELARERQYVLKKLNFSESEFAAIMEATPASHTDFETEGSLFYEYRFLLPFRSAWERTRDLIGLKRRIRPTYSEIR